MSFIREHTVIVGLATVLLLAIGWLFTLIVSSQQDMRDHIEALAVAVARLEATVGGGK